MCVLVCVFVHPQKVSEGGVCRGGPVGGGGLWTHSLSISTCCLWGHVHLHQWQALQQPLYPPVSPRLRKRKQKMQSRSTFWAWTSSHPINKVLSYSFSFYLSWQHTIRCTKDGRWTEEFTMCTRLAGACTPPPDVNQVQFACDESFNVGKSPSQLLQLEDTPHYTYSSTLM